MKETKKIILVHNDRQEKINYFFGESKDFSALKREIHSSRENTLKYDLTLRHRQLKTSQFAKMIESYTKETKEKMLGIPISVFKKEYSKYRDTTASLVEVLLSSPFYQKSYHEIDELPVLGNAIQIAKYPNHSVEWFQSRVNSVGGSDVGILADYDFGEKSSQQKYKLRRAEQSKLNKTSQELKDLSHSQTMTNKGALYRGTVWEDKIRDIFASKNKDIEVFNVKNQFVSKDNEWARINLDGIIKKSGEIVGIFEAKTSSSMTEWENNSIPLMYRAQALYYLYVTGLEYVHFGILVSDSKYIERIIYKDEPISYTYGITMDTYINDRVLPWFQNIRVSKIA